MVVRPRMRSWLMFLARASIVEQAASALARLNLWGKRLSPEHSSLTIVMGPSHGTQFCAATNSAANPVGGVRKVYSHGLYTVNYPLILAP